MSTEAHDSHALASAYLLAQQGHMHDAVDQLLSTIDNALEAGRFDTVDRWLDEAPFETLPLTLVLAWLSFTLWAKDRLPARAGAYDRIRTLLEAREPTRWQSLLRGLK
jgi:hypothetical protein